MITLILSLLLWFSYRSSYDTSLEMEREGEGGRGREGGGHGNEREGDKDTPSFSHSLTSQLAFRL